MTFSTVAQWIGVAAACALLFASGMQFRDWTAPEKKPGRPMVIDTTRSDRTLPPDEPVAWPEMVTVYQTVRDTVRACVTVPEDFDLSGVVEPNPISIDDRWFRRDRLTFTYFDPQTRQYVRSYYTAPVPSWEIWGDVGTAAYVPALSGSAATNPLIQADARLHVRHDRLTVYAGIGTLGTSPMATVGVRARLFQIQF